MSHCTPEYNRPQEGEESEEPFPMSDKPTVKPFDAQLHHPSCSQHDRDLIWFCNQCGAKESADEWHNAALAASLPDERWVTQQLQAANKLCEGLQQQIAAERELRERAEANMRVFIEKEHTPIVEQLRQQIDARDKQWERQIEALVEQLAAAVERSKELSEDLEHYSEIIDKREQQLADERAESWRQTSQVKSHAREIQHLQKQLAAEREKVQTVNFALGKIDTECRQLRKQLEAEREKYQRSQEKVREYFDLLAAERAKVQALVIAIEHRVKIWLRRGGDEHWNSHMQNAYKECANELTDALAKAKDGK